MELTCVSGSEHIWRHHNSPLGTSSGHPSWCIASVLYHWFLHTQRLVSIKTEPSWSHTVNWNWNISLYNLEIIIVNTKPPKTEQSRSAKTFPTLFPPKEIIFFCSSKDPPSPAVFAYWKHPIGPPAEHKAPGAQATQRRSFWGLQPQCLWRSLSPLGLIRGLHKENERVKEIREN